MNKNHIVKILITYFNVLQIMSIFSKIGFLLEPDGITSQENTNNIPNYFYESLTALSTVLYDAFGISDNDESKELFDILSSNFVVKHEYFNDKIIMEYLQLLADKDLYIK